MYMSEGLCCERAVIHVCRNELPWPLPMLCLIRRGRHLMTPHMPVACHICISICYISNINIYEFSSI